MSMNVQQLTQQLLTLQKRERLEIVRFLLFLDDNTASINVESEWDNEIMERVRAGRMYSLGEVNFIQGMLDLGNYKNSVGLKPIAVRLRQTEQHQRLEFLP